MDFHEQINKIKIALFGNVWMVRLVKLLRYLSVGLVGWLISRSEYLFLKPSTPKSTFMSLWNWKDQKFERLSSSFFIFVFFCLLIFVYFYLSGLVVEWLIRINLSPRQQVQIIEKKNYAVDEKTHYSVEKIANLENTVFWNSPYVYLSSLRMIPLFVDLEEHTV